MGGPLPIAGAGAGAAAAEGAAKGDRMAGGMGGGPRPLLKLASPPRSEAIGNGRASCRGRASALYEQRRKLSVYGWRAFDRVGTK